MATYAVLPYGLGLAATLGLDVGTGTSPLPLLGGLAFLASRGDGLGDKTQQGPHMNGLQLSDHRPGGR